MCTCLTHCTAMTFYEWTREDAHVLFFSLKYMRACKCARARTHRHTHTRSHNHAQSSSCLFVLLIQCRGVMQRHDPPRTGKEAHGGDVCDKGGSKDRDDQHGKGELRPEGMRARERVHVCKILCFDVCGCAYYACVDVVTVCASAMVVQSAAS